MLHQIKLVEIVEADADGQRVTGWMLGEERVTVPGTGASGCERCGFRPTAKGSEGTAEAVAHALRCG